MTRGSALTILATTRSAEFGNRISGLLAKLEDVRVDVRIGDLAAVTGEAGEALERADVLLVDVDPDSERELRQLGRIIEQRRGKSVILATASNLSAQGVRGLIRQGVDDFIPQPFELSDLLEAIAAARVKLRQARMDGKLGKVIAVSRAKGGMGASTLAAHIALALREKRNRRDPEQAGGAARSRSAVRRPRADARSRAEQRDGRDHPRPGAPRRRAAARFDDPACQRPVTCCRRRARSCRSTLCRFRPRSS